MKKGPCKNLLRPGDRKRKGTQGSNSIEVGSGVHSIPFSKLSSAVSYESVTLTASAGIASEGHGCEEERDQLHCVAFLAVWPLPPLFNGGIARPSRATRPPAAP